MRGRRRTAAPREREPHPDPRVEVQLQQVLSLLRAAQGNEGMLDRIRANHALVSEMVARHPTWDGHVKRLAEIQRLNAEIARLNEETAALHAKVQELCSAISDNDLTFLYAR